MQSNPSARRLSPPGIVAVLLSLALLSACTTTANVRQIDRLESVRENPRVILMPPDIRYYLVTTGGITEPHAEWTEAAQANFTTALTDYAASIGTDLSVVDRNNLGETDIRYEKLYSAVGLTILNHQFGYYPLPSKGNGQIFDWSLGPGISALADQYDADYGLFVYYRDHQATGGRVAFAILAAAAGAAVNMGGEGGFASLVDLRTGDIVWFNVVSNGAGELREEAGAAAAVEALFRDMPTNRTTDDIE